MKAGPTLKRDPLDPLTSAVALGTGRSPTFPFPQWRARDRFRTVYFDEGEGPPLVLVHGLGGNATHWELVAKELVGSHRVIGLDLVGCGWSAKPRVSYGIELLCDHLLEFLDSLGLPDGDRPTSLVGHSLGAAVCTVAALRRPGQLGSLTLICPAGITPVSALLRLAAPLVVRRQLLYPYFRFGASLALGGWFVDKARDNPNVRWFMESTIQDQAGGANLKELARVSESLCADIVRHHYADRLSELELPVLALLSDSDSFTSSAPVQRQLRRIPRLQIVVVERCGHMPMVERPEQTLHHLRRFLLQPP